jgi:hypothetical protein
MLCGAGSFCAPTVANAVASATVAVAIAVVTGLGAQV